jgi:hypothetical protein
MFKVPSASLQTFIYTRLTLTPPSIPDSNYIIMVSDWNCLKYFCLFFLYCNHQMHRDFLITLYFFQYRLIKLRELQVRCIDVETFLNGRNWRRRSGTKLFWIDSCETNCVVWTESMFPEGRYQQPVFVTWDSLLICGCEPVIPWLSSFGSFTFTDITESHHRIHCWDFSVQFSSHFPILILQFHLDPSYSQAT